MSAFDETTLKAFEDVAKMMIEAGICPACAGRLGPDTTERPMCYGCGPVEMIPAGVLTDNERARRRAAEEWP